jgi:putative ABC transport system ATP-binding protein
LELAMTHLGFLGLESVAQQLPDELSGGQAQRVAIARVLAMRPKLILADEPTGRLDSAAARQVVALLIETADELGGGLVIATHDPYIADQMSTRWRMRDGELSEVPDAAVGVGR